MNDDVEIDPEDDELLIIDPRSPGERWAESGRAGFGRVQASFAGQALAVAALCWMIGIALWLGAEVWEAFHLGSTFGPLPDHTVWVRMMFLAQTGTLVVPVATLAGLGLVVLAGTARARMASWLGLVLAVWVLAAGAMGVLVAIHGYDFPVTTLSDNRFAFGVASFGSFVLGAIVTGAAWRLATSRATEDL